MKPISLSTQLSCTAEVVEQVFRGQSLDRCIENLPADVRAGVKALSYHAIRHLGLSRAVADLLLQKQPPLSVCALLWVSISLLLEACDSENALLEHSPIYKPYVLVSQAVEAAKKNPKMRSFPALINGVLRRFMREKAQLISQTQEKSIFAKWNFQSWWIKRLQQDWPMQWEDILQCAQVPASMVLRVNAQWATPDQACKYLSDQGVKARVVGLYALELETPMNVSQIPGFEQGYFSVQSAAAQLAAPLLLDKVWLSQRNAQQPLHVLDACCAPGGKTAHLLEITPKGLIELVAVDSDKSRLEKVEQTLNRIGLKAQIRHADLSSKDAFKSEELFDAILLDAPCSASGIVRRHPDIRWLRKETDIEQLAALQSNILDVLWGKLKPGGRLLYSTCSVFKAEGFDQAQNFKLRQRVTKQCNTPSHILPLGLKDGVVFCGTSSSQPIAADGFYYALFEK